MTADATAGGATNPERPVDRPRDRELVCLLDSVPAIVGLWDLAQRNRYGNQAYADFFGIAPEELRGIHYRELLGDELYRDMLPHVSEALAGRTAVISRSFVDHRGGLRSVRCCYSPMLVEGTVEGFTVLVLDITAHIEDEQRTRAALIESARRQDRGALVEAVHSSVLQNLFAAVLDVDRAIAGLRRGDASAGTEDRLERLGDLLKDTMKQLRTITASD